MPRIVPSQAVAVIDQLFTFAATQVDDPKQRVNLTMGHMSTLAALVDLLEEIPPELITVDGPAFAKYVCCIAAIRNAIETWKARGDVQALVVISGLGNLHPVTWIRRILSDCPDEAPSPCP